MHRFVHTFIAAAAFAVAAPSARAALIISLGGASGAPGATVTVPVYVSDDTATSPAVNAFVAGIVVSGGTFGASTDTSRLANVPQFLGIFNFFDSGDFGDPAQGRTASAIDYLSDATAGETVNKGQLKGLLLASFTIPATARRGDLYGVTVDRRLHVLFHARRQQRQLHAAAVHRRHDDDRRHPRTGVAGDAGPHRRDAAAAAAEGVRSRRRTACRPNQFRLRRSSRLRRYRWLHRRSVAQPVHLSTGRSACLDGCLPLPGRL